jgi:chromosome segregation ATPase
MPSGSETLPPELRKRIEAIEVAMVAAIGRARIEERATTATLLEDIREDGERRIHALAAIESAGADDAIALAETLDVMNERVEDLKATLATTEARANQAESRQAIAEARAEEAERSVARTNDTVHALRIERDALQVALTSLQKSLDPLIARRSLTPPSAPRRTRRAVRSDAKAP